MEREESEVDDTAAAVAHAHTDDDDDDDDDENLDISAIPSSPQSSTEEMAVPEAGDTAEMQPAEKAAAAAESESGNNKIEDSKTSDATDTSSGSSRKDTTSGDSEAVAVGSPGPDDKAVRQDSARQQSMLEQSWPSLRMLGEQTLVFPVKRLSLGISTGSIISKGGKLLKKVIADIATYKASMVELDVEINKQMDFAKDRYVTESHIGAALAFKKVKVSELEMKQFMAVIENLQTQKIDLITQIEEAKEIQKILDGGGEEAMKMASSEAAGSLALDLTTYNKCEAAIQKILATAKDSCIDYSDQELLDELKEITSSGADGQGD